MRNEDLIKKTLELADPLARARGLEIWGVEVTGSPVVVRVFVDVPAGASTGDNNSANCPQALSASMDDCEEISRELGLAMDVEDTIPNAWVLEVSTPGLDRKFFRLEQMAPYVGDVVEVRLAEAIPFGDGSGRKVFRGRLAKVGEDYLELQPCSVSAAGEVVLENAPMAHLQWANVRHAKREHIFRIPQKPGKTAGKNGGKRKSSRK